MSQTLVIMAAGIGSRFGGTKQLAAVGPDGEAFLDFAIVDAAAAGVDDTVIVVRTDIEDDIRRHVERRHADRSIRYVRQDELGPRRAKPWGTGHAVLAAAPLVDGDFIVCNADDYYGRSTYAAVACAAADMAADRAYLAGFRLDRTLPDSGEVSRGLCAVADGELVSLVETHAICRREDGTVTATDPAGVLADDAVVSMNLWAFPHGLFNALSDGWDRFHAERGEEETSEFLLPAVVDDLRTTGELTVGVVPTDETWVGVTNPDDLAVARIRIAEMRA